MECREPTNCVAVGSWVEAAAIMVLLTLLTLSGKGLFAACLFSVGVLSGSEFKCLRVAAQPCQVERGRRARGEIAWAGLAVWNLKCVRSSPCLAKKGSGMLRKGCRRNETGVTTQESFCGRHSGRRDRRAGQAGQA